MKGVKVESRAIVIQNTLHCERVAVPAQGPGRSAPGRRRRTQHRTHPASCSCTDSGILMVWLQCGRDTRCKTDGMSPKLSSTYPLYLWKCPFSRVTIFSGSLVSKMASTQGVWDPITRIFFSVTFIKSAASYCGGQFMFSILFKWSYLGHKMWNIGISLKTLSSLEFVH